MINFKKGVMLHNMTPQICLAIYITDAVYERFGYELTITSVNDSSHMTISKHYEGNAFDTRIWGIEKEFLDQIIFLMKQHLGNNYDVVFEGDHIHVEYDPKEK